MILQRTNYQSYHDGVYSQLNVFTNHKKEKVEGLNKSRGKRNFLERGSTIHIELLLYNTKHILYIHYIVGIYLLNIPICL